MKVFWLIAEMWDPTIIDCQDNGSKFEPIAN